MPERDPAQRDAALAALLDRLALGDLPEPLLRAVAETLEWVGELDREAASADPDAAG